jgi:hypothetical protein
MNTSRTGDIGGLGDIMSTDRSRMARDIFDFHNDAACLDEQSVPIVRRQSNVLLLRCERTVEMDLGPNQHERRCKGHQKRRPGFQ